MRPNDIDNKLKDAFLNENSPAKPELWNNIVAEMDKGTFANPKNTKKPFNSSIFKILIGTSIIATISTFYFLSKNEKINQNKDIISSETNINNQNSAIKNNKNLEDINFNSDNDINSKNVIEADNIKSNSNSPLNGDKLSTIKNENKIAIDNNNNVNSSNTVKRNYKNNNQKEQLKSLNKNLFNLSRSNKFNSNPINDNIFNELTENYSLNKVNTVKKLKTKYFYEDIQKTQKDFNNKLKIVKKSKVRDNQSLFNAKTTNADFDKKFWLGFGFGQTQNFNKAVFPSDVSMFMHKEIVPLKDEFTGNSKGVNANLLFNYYFYKTFNFETGIEYFNRQEEIRFDHFTLNIPDRDTNNVIYKYKTITLYELMYNQSLGKYDTIAVYDLGISHSLGQDNKYHVFSIPLRFNNDFWISNNTRIKIGFGANLSYFYSKSRYYLDYVASRSVKYSNPRFEFNTNINAQLGVFTNFFNVGEIGIYSNFTKHINDWSVDNKQYKISMSDLHAGVSFRMPIGR